MLTTYLLVQVAINAALVCGMILLVRERRAAARLALEREARLEALARELCALGGELARAEGRKRVADGPRPPLVEVNAGPTAPILKGAPGLEQRSEEAHVPERQRLSEGELQILRNLRRRPLRPEALGGCADAECPPAHRHTPLLAGAPKARPRAVPLDRGERGSRGARQRRGEVVE
jgi:hypothetical protein